MRLSIVLGLVRPRVNSVCIVDSSRKRKTIQMPHCHSCAPTPNRNLFYVFHVTARSEENAVTLIEIYSAVFPYCSCRFLLLQPPSLVLFFYFIVYRVGDYGLVRLKLSQQSVQRLYVIELKPRIWGLFYGFPCKCILRTGIMDFGTVSEKRKYFLSYLRVVMAWKTV